MGRMAGEFAAVFNAQELAQVMGWLHDLGKYTLPFQARLRGSPCAWTIPPGARASPSSAWA
ncbi:hypothetical protein GO496_03315 [Acidovorax citrulli]|nr:hypothetical protein [Paracidovorax citrulli]